MLRSNAKPILLYELQSRIADIEYSFSGVSAPSPGSNTNSFGLCHTTGGLYTAGEVVYDDGISLLIVSPTIVKHLTTRSAISGGISLQANGVYCNQAGTWILKGGIGSGGIDEDKILVERTTGLVMVVRSTGNVLVRR